MRAFYPCLTLILAAAAPLYAQTPTQPPTTSAILRPGLDAVEAGLANVRPDRWKLPQPARDDVQSNLGSIHRDLETTLPPLVATADGNPPSLAAALPVSRNVNALYDVLLRIEERAKAGAPADQIAALEQARAALDTARRALDDALAGAATAQESQLRRLQAAASTPPPPCPPAPTKKKKSTAK
jgi:hypothetical protein